VETDVNRIAPAGWSTAEDGSHRCPTCSTEAARAAPAPDRA
jgi:hypothetical protein